METFKPTRVTKRDGVVLVAGKLGSLAILVEFDPDSAGAEVYGLDPADPRAGKVRAAAQRAIEQRRPRWAWWL